MKILSFVLTLLVWGNLKANCSLELSITGVISAATADYVARGFEEAQRQSCTSVFLSINTPGGVLVSTRKIVSQIMNSPIPVLCLVEPGGAHAGSAGAIVLQACHIAGAVKASNIGAATPILADGKNISDDLRKKMINDTVSWLDSITEVRKRNKEFGQKIVTEAKAVSASEAKSISAIDILAEDRTDFWSQVAAMGRVDMGNSSFANLKNQSQEMQKFEEDMRFQILKVVADPQFSYLIFMGSLALIYFELTHPGMIAPGVLGALGIVISLVVFDKLEVEWGGLLLILLGVAFMIAEVFVPSFGALGIGGLASFIVGGFFLFDPAKGYQIPVQSILGVGGLIGLLMLGIGYLAYKSTKVKKRGGYEGLVGVSCKLRMIDPANPKRGEVLVRGEIWKVEAESELNMNDSVRIISVKGLLLKVKTDKLS